MKVILKQDIAQLGYINDTVVVKDGYARNYLIPFGFAIQATAQNEKILAEVSPMSEEVSEGVIEDGIAERVVKRHILIADDSTIARKQIQRYV